MSRYIDADHLIQRATNPYGDCWSSTCEGTPDFVDYINEEPTAEVKPIVYGEWIHREELFDDEEKPRMVWGCNKCGFSLKSIHDKRNFCPNCGAVMRKESKE